MDTYGLIGYPLGHSFSRDFFRDKFQGEQLDAEYLNFEVPDAHDVLEVLAAHPTLRGFNVTIPYKEKIIPYLDEVSKEARAIGAVNVVRVEHRGSKRRLLGFNTDVTGFTQSIRPFIRSHHTKALILGTGGSSKAVNYALTHTFGMQTLLVSRYERPGTVTYQALTPEALQEYCIIVNCTPVGMFPKTTACPAIPYEALTGRHLLFDLIYNPEQTLFLKKGKAQGADTKNGLEMLLLQALESWRIWTAA